MHKDKLVNVLNPHDHVRNRHGVLVEGIHSRRFSALAFALLQYTYL